MSDSSKHIDGWAPRIFALARVWKDVGRLSRAEDFLALALRSRENISLGQLALRSRKYQPSATGPESRKYQPRATGPEVKKISSLLQLALSVWCTLALKVPVCILPACFRNGDLQLCGNGHTAAWKRAYGCGWKRAYSCVGRGLRLWEGVYGCVNSINSARWRPHCRVKKCSSTADAAPSWRQSMRRRFLDAPLGKDYLVNSGIRTRIKYSDV
ncbi:hypothetical protein Btru_059838 [Bulinus truncatus]|nr:hypothetical protein Btru_059838 [Bulinus truncatus]